MFSDANRTARRALPVFLLLALAGCQKKVTGPPPRYVVLRFENLSGDPSLEWVARGASEFLSRSLAGAMDGPVLNPAALNRLSSTLGARPAKSPGISSERSEAVVAGGTRAITGYFERSPAGLRIEATELDLQTGKSVRSVSGAGPEPMKALASLARNLSPTAAPYLTSNGAALRSFIDGFEGTGEQAIGNLEASVHADPSFGPAWVLLVNAYLAGGKAADAGAVLDKARSQRLDKYDEANLDLASSILRNDPKERLAAIHRISALSPGDTVLLRSTAEADTHAGNFQDAAAEWNKLAAVLPADPNAWNQFGYSRAWSGDYVGALAAMREYARIRPNDPNPLDSIGDVHYMFRNYKEAADSYLQANTKDPAFQNGGDLYKAAWAKFEAGDKTGADAAFAQFRAAQQKAKSQEAPLVEADWLYRTGRKAKAIAVLSAQPDAAAHSQLAIWDLLAGDRKAAATEAAAAGQPTTPAAFLARFVSLPSASADEWQHRAQVMLAAPAVAPLRNMAIGYALLLDDKQDDALPVWKRIADNSDGTDFFSRAMYARLNGEQPKLALLPDPNSINQFAALLESL